MIRMISTVVVIAMAAAASMVAERQQSGHDVSRERARQPYNTGLEHLQAEKFEQAVRSFEEAIKLDPTFDMAYYMLGRTHMQTKSYAAAAIALTRCRDLHLEDSRRQSLTRQEIQQQRRRRIDDVNERIRQLQERLSSPPPPTNGDQLRTEITSLQERKRQLEDAERQLSPAQAVPGYVSVALGSAFFRSGKLADAEEAYRSAIGADPKIGEAHNNLAVVYMETGRYAEAEKSVKAAERAGMRVPQALKDEIAKRKKSGS